MTLSLQMVPRMAQELHCVVCEGDMMEGAELCAELRAKNEPVTVFLALVKMGCCPLCGRSISGGQTPDYIVGRYVRYLKRQG